MFGPNLLCAVPFWPLLVQKVFSTDKKELILEDPEIMSRVVCNYALGTRNYIEDVLCVITVKQTTSQPNDLVSSRVLLVNRILASFDWSEVFVVHKLLLQIIYYPLSQGIDGYLCDGIVSFSGVFWGLDVNDEVALSLFKFLLLQIQLSNSNILPQ